MIEHRHGCIFAQPDVDIIVHQANCFCQMGSGIAKEIARLYPEAVTADRRSKKGDKSKLGSYTVGVSDHGIIIINLYSQYHYGKTPNTCYTDYGAMKTGLLEIKDDYDTPIANNVLAIPYKMGCGLAGGDWNIVHKIIHEVFDDTRNLKVVICEKD